MAGESQTRQSSAGAASRRRANYVQIVGTIGLLACVVVLFDGFRVAQGRTVECRDPGSSQVTCFTGGNLTLGLGIVAASVAAGAIILLGLFIANSLLRSGSTSAGTQ